MPKKKTITDETIDELNRTLKRMRAYRDERYLASSSAHAAAKRAALDLRFKLVEWGKGTHWDKKK